MDTNLKFALYTVVCVFVVFSIFGSVVVIH